MFGLDVGRDDQGQCGVGTTNDVYRPAPVIGMGARVRCHLNVQASAQPGAVDPELEQR